MTVDNRTSAQMELTRQVERVARECRSARRWRAVLRFAWVLFPTTVVLTAALRYAPEGWFSAWAALVIWSVVGLVAFVRRVVLPLRTPITVEQVALFIDEHHPELENRIITAIQSQSEKAPSESDWMLHYFLSEALPKLSQTSFTDEVHQHGFSRHGLNGLALIAACVAIGIAYREMWFADFGLYDTRSDGETSVLPFTVEPGDTRVRQGDNLMVWVRGADEHDKVVVRWSENGAEWQSETARRGTTGDVSFHEFRGVRNAITYQVRAGDAQSPLFTITPWLPADVDTIDLRYDYPDYLGKPDREVPNSGHVTGVEGTVVEFSINTNRKVDGATMVFESGERVPLTSGSEGVAWKHEIVLAKADTYWIELEDAGEELDPDAFRTKYAISVKRDKPPEVQVAFPRGDGQVTMLEELPFRFVVTDDFGFDEYGLQYQIGGNPPVQLPLEAEGGVMTKIEGEHILPLEDLAVNVGDLITWTVWARDAKPDRQDYEMVGDPYFIEVRPFRYLYRESVSDAGGGGGGGGEEGELVTRMREIIIATWDLRRDAAYLEEEEFTERRDVIRDSISSVLETVSQAPTTGADGVILIELQQTLNRAIEGLNTLDITNPAAGLSEAAVQEQRAYHLMLKLQNPDIEVQQQQGGGGGGGGQSDRFGIDELELDRNRNFYEEEQSTQQQQQEAVNELANRLKELARRQKLIDEEIAKLISELQRAQTPEEEEELRRRLEKLEEELERNLEQLDEAEQDMSSSQMTGEQSQQARGAMREARRELNQSLENIQEEELQQARASSARATNALEDLERQLRQLSGGAAAERLRQIQEDLDELEDRQRGIQQQAEELREQHNSPSFEGMETMEAQQEQLEADKAKLAQDYVELMNEAGDLADRARESQELMSRSLGDWLRETAREGILEDIEESQPLVRYGVWDTAAESEGRILDKFEKVSDDLARVAENLVEDELESKQLALERLQELLDQAEEMREEMAGGAPNEQGDQQGAGGENDEEGSRGEESEDGEQMGPGGEPSEDSEQRGPGEGESEGQQLAQNGEPDGEQQGTRSGTDAPGEQGEEGNTPGNEGQNESDETTLRRMSSNPGGGSQGETSEQIMRRFVSEDYNEWVEELRDVESLLPNDSDVREGVGRVRESIESFRRAWRDRALAPKYDLFIELADEPLREAADQLHREIQLERGEAEFVLVDESEIPHKYRELVAEYFRDLSHAEDAQ